MRSISSAQIYAERARRTTNRFTPLTGDQDINRSQTENTLANGHAFFRLGDFSPSSSVAVDSRSAPGSGKTPHKWRWIPSGKGIYRNQFVEAFLTKRESASRLRSVRFPPDSCRMARTSAGPSRANSGLTRQDFHPINVIDFSNPWRARGARRTSQLRPFPPLRHLVRCKQSSGRLRFPLGV